MDGNGEIDTSTERRIRAAQTVRVVVWVVVLAVVVVFAAANAQDVEVDWLLDDGDIALWIVIAGSALAGFVLGFVAAARRRR